MSLSESSNLMRQMFSDICDSENILFTVENLDVSPPDDDNWARLDIMAGGSIQQELGVCRDRNTGVAQLTLLAPSGTHTAALEKIADSVKVAFTGGTYILPSGGSLRFRSAGFQRLGADGKWWALAVICPFEVETAL